MRGGGWQGDGNLGEKAEKRGRKAKEKGKIYTTIRNILQSIRGLTGTGSREV